MTAPSVRPAPPVAVTGTRPDVQGLRAVAVLLVVLAHVGVPWLPGGFVGVDVFFVISGFLITGLLLREREATGRIRLRAFFARRARRILPAATVVLLATVGYAAATLPASRVGEVVTDSRWSAVFLANVHFAQVDGDYFAQGRDTSPLLHFWSLGVEEQFYLVWPALLVLVLVCVARRRSAAVLVATVLGVVWCASYALAIAQEGRPAAYYGTLPRAWELATGALLALASPLLLRLGPLRPLLAAAGLAAIGAAAVRYDAGLAGPELLLPVAGAAAVLAAGTLPQGTVLPLVARPLTRAPMVWTGDRSYSLYLWHWPVIVLVAPSLGSGAVATGVVALAITAVLAEVGFRLVETPFRRGRVPAVRGSFALVLWPVTVLAVVCSGPLASAWADAALEERRIEARQYYAEHPEAMPTPSAQVAAPPVRQVLAEAVRLADAGAPIPGDLVNEEGLHEDHWQNWFDCYADWEESAVPLCPLGDRGAARTVLVYGDSQAGMLLPALDLVGRARGFRVLGLVKFGCGPYEVSQSAFGERFVACDEFRHWARARIRELEPDVLVLGARGMLALDPHDGLSDRDAWSRGVRATLDEVVAEAGEVGEVVVVGGVGALGVRPPSCLSDRGSDLAACTTPEDERSLVANELTRAAAVRQGLTYVDLAGLACVRHRCPLVAERTVLYRDPAHLSMTWMRRVAWELTGLMRLS
jgi:peptidoglycan/LPS O-acetylase OafA/YrhL